MEEDKKAELNLEILKKHHKKEVKDLYEVATSYGVDIMVAYNRRFYTSTKILKELMVKYPVKSGGDNWEARGHIIPKEDLLNYEL